MTAITSTLSPSSKLFAIFLGIAVPSLAFGRVVFAILMALAVISLCISRPCRDVVRDLRAQCQTPVGILILLTFVVWLPNVFVSDFSFRSFEAVTRTLILAGIAGAFYSRLIIDARLVDISLRAFMVMAGISLLFTMLSITVLPELFWTMRLQGWSAQPIGTKLKGFSALAVVILPVLLLAGYRSTTKVKIVAVILSLGYLILAFETYNRAAIAGFLMSLVGVALAILINSGTKKRALAILGGTGALVMGTITWLRVTRNAFEKSYGAQGDWLFPVWLIDYQRQTIWEATWNYAMEAPWFGRGANTINFAPGANAVIKGTDNLHVIPAHPHNWLLEVFAETGAVGLMALLVVIIVMGVKALLDYRREGRVNMIAATAIMGGYWGSGIFNFSYWSVWWQVSFMLSLVFCYAASGKSETVR